MRQRDQAQPAAAYKRHCITPVVRFWTHGKISPTGGVRRVNLRREARDRARKSPRTSYNDCGSGTLGVSPSKTATQSRAFFYAFLGYSCLQLRCGRTPSGPRVVPLADSW